MFVLVFAALAGGLATAAVGASWSLLAAILAAPVGGSFAAAGAAVLVAARRPGSTAHAREPSPVRTDEQVAALRQILDRARRPDVSPRPESDAA